MKKSIYVSCEKVDDQGAYARNNIKIYLQLVKVERLNYSHSLFSYHIFGWVCDTVDEFRRAFRHFSIMKESLNFACKNERFIIKCKVLK